MENEETVDAEDKEFDISSADDFKKVLAFLEKPPSRENKYLDNPMSV